MSAHEIDAGFQWIYATLSGDGTLSGYAPGGVFRSLAPPGTVTPYIIMAYQGGSDVVTMNGVRLIVDAVFQVKAVGPANTTANIASAAERIDQLIGSPPTAGTTPDGLGAILSSYRQSPIL